MKLKVGDKEAFDQWHNGIIDELTKENSPYFDEGSITLLHPQKLSSTFLKWDLNEIEVPATTSVESVIHLLTGKPPITVTHSILGVTWTYLHLYCLSVSGNQLDLSKTLADYDIQEGDLLLLEQKTHVTDTNIHIQRLVIPTMTQEVIDFFTTVRTTNDIENSLRSSTQYHAFGYSPVEESLLLFTDEDNDLAQYIRYTVQSLLLYTDEDNALAQYIRYNFPALNVLTGTYLNVYTIEQPTQIKGISAREYWKAVLDEATYSFSHLMGWTRYKPYDKAGAYEIAKMLGIYPDALPCVVIFGNIKSDEKIVVTITGEIKTFFRGLSTVVLMTKKKIEGKKVKRHDNFNEFKNMFIESWNIWQKEAGEKEQTTTFIFNGQTVFINKPSGQLEIKDFQNG